MDATLREIGSLILEVNPDTRRRGTVFEFRLVCPESTKNIARLKTLGSITIGQKGFDDNKTLAQLGWVKCPLYLCNRFNICKESESLRSWNTKLD